MERRRRIPWGAQIATIVPLVPAWIVALATLTVIAAGDERFVEDVLLDANDRTGAEWYVGIVTWLVVLCWGAAAISAAWARGSRGWSAVVTLGTSSGLRR